MNIWNECRKLCLHHTTSPPPPTKCVRQVTEHSNHICYFQRTPNEHTLLACNYRRFSSAKRNRLYERTAEVIAPLYEDQTIAKLIPPSTTYRNRINSLLRRGVGGGGGCYCYTTQYTVHFIGCHSHGNAAIISGQNVVATWGRRFGLLAFDQRRMCSYIGFHIAAVTGVFVLRSKIQRNS